MSRITRISGSLAIVLVAYWAYALTAVPLIEPPAPKQSIASGGAQKPAPTVDDMQRDEIKPLFRRGDWELDPEKTKVLESDRAMLLFQRYSPLGGDKVEITPCTIVFLSDGAAENAAQRIRQSIVLQAPRAVLHFDRDLDQQPREAKLLDGQLDGKILIRSDWKRPGPEDDLLIVTSNVQLDQQRIFTPERVRFNWGPHFGSGQGMEIKLLPGKSGTTGLDVAGIASFELRHLERLHLELGPEGQSLLAGPEKGTGPICRNGPEGAAHKLDLSPFPPARPKTPVDIACSGPFRFDVVRRVATFHDNVRVVKANPAGDPDQVACDVLSLWFADRRSDAAAEKGTGPICRNGPEGAAHKLDLSPFPPQPAGSLDLVPERLEAVGNPVVVTAPSSNATAQGKRMEYNLLSNSLTLDGDEPVFLQQGPNQICARSLYYESAAEEGRLGQLVAQGPGWLRGQSPDQPGQRLEAVWREQLRIQPRDQYKEISFVGGVELKSPDVGQLQAQRLCLWLIETPSPGGKKFDLQPHGLTASEDVSFGSPQISGKVDELEVWFEKEIRDQGPGVGGQDGGLAAPRREAAAAFARREGGMGGSPSIGAPNNATASNGPETPPSPATIPRHFEVTGRRLRARVLYGWGEPALTDLTIEDNVQLLETQNAQPGKQPVLIRGSRLDVTNAHAPDAVATVVGQPAHFEGDGLALSGAAIKVNSGTNHLTIDGPGQMEITTANDLEGKPLPAPCQLLVTWQGGMDFDGQTAHFDQSVVASTPGMFSSEGEMTQFRLNTAAMAVRLHRPIRFSEAKMQEPPQVETISCEGGVTVDSRTFKAGQQLIAHDQMQVSDLGINQLGGGLTGGPGWINSVRYGAADLLPGQPNAANNAPAKPDQRYCLHVAFQKSISGNILFRQVTFRDNVRASFAPVDSWDAMLTTNDPARLGPKGAVITCNELQAFQPLLPFGGDRRAIELYALGNAKVEGVEYTALANRITYAQAKGVLTLEGSGLAPAELLQQKRAGAQAKRAIAQKIRYHLQSQDYEVDGPQMLEVPLPGGKK